MDSSSVEAADAEAVHPYYRLLPSYITPESVEAERQDFLSHIQETLECLQSLSDKSALDCVLENHHFRDVDIFFKLKHKLPVQLHAQLIRVLVELLWTRDGRCFTDVDMEIRAVKTLQLLLKKWKKVQPEGTRSDDLVINWRSVKRAIERVCFRAPGCIQQASHSYLAKLSNTTVKCAETARSFFRATDPAVPLVRELWTEFGATIKDVKTTECFRALASFSFLLSLSPPEGARTEQVVVELLPEWFSVWPLISRCSEWDGHWMKILSRVAKQYSSTPMLDEYLPFVYAKIHDLLELPSDLGSPFKKQLWPSAYTSLNGTKRFGQHVMRLCVYLLRDENDDDGNDAPIKYLLDILSLMKYFFHPSNVANVGNSLATFVYYLSNALSKRLGREKNDTKGLHLISVCKIVDAILELCLLGIYSKNRGVSTKCMYVMKNLLCIDPARCAVPVMEEMLKALDPMAMSHSHLAVTAISSMAVFLYHLMCGQHPKSTGLFFSTYLEPMLKLTLPGIDANDEKKTQSTVQLYFHILSWLPLVNDPAKGNFQATKQRGELSKELFAGMQNSLFAEFRSLNSQIDESLWEIGPFLEEWTFAVLDRCFQFIQSRSSARSGSANSDGSRNGKSSCKDGSGDAIVLQVLNLLAIMYAQMSPEIYAQCLRKTVVFVSNAFYTTTFGGKVISTLIFNCMQGNPSDAIGQFMPFVLEKFHVTKTGMDVSSLTANEKVWYLRILDGLVRFSQPDHSILLRYQSELNIILAHFLSIDHDKNVYDAASTVLRHLLNGLLGVYTHDFRSLPAAEWEDATSSTSGAFQYLGIGISWSKLSVKWHEPDEAELLFGLNLLQDHVIGALSEMEGMMQAKDLTVRTWTRFLSLVFQGLCGAANVLTDDSVMAEGLLLSGARPLLLKALKGNPEKFKQFVSLKTSLMSSVHNIAAFWSEFGRGSAMESQVWRLQLDVIHQLLIWRGEHLDEFGVKESQNMYSRITSLDIASHAYRKYVNRESKRDHVLVLSRNELVEKVMFLYAKRKVQQHFAVANAIMKPESDEKTRHCYEALLIDVERLLANSYEDVRSGAAAVMKECSVLYARWVFFRQPRHVEKFEGLRNTERLKEEQVSGVLHMLSLTVARQNLWKKRSTLLKRVLIVLLTSIDAILKQGDSEVSKAKIEVKLQTFLLSLLSSWRYVRGQSEGPPLLDLLVEAEPSPAEHWKFQLMHLVVLYPLLQLEEMPVSVGLWKLVIRQLGNEVLPVRQIALEVFQKLLKLLQHENNMDGSTDVKMLDGLIYSDGTIQAILHAFVNNHKNSNKFAASADGQHANSAPSDWSFGVNEVVRHISNTSQSFPKAPPLSSVRMLNQASNTISNVTLSNVKLIQKLVKGNATAFFGSRSVDILNTLASDNIGSDIGEEDRQAAFHTLADCIAGLLHALVQLERTEEENVARYVAAVLNLLKTVLPHVSIVLVDQWVEVFYLSFRPSRFGAVKLDRLQPLVRYLLGELEDSFARATVEDYARQAKWLALVEATGVHLLAAGVLTSDPALQKLVFEFGDRVVSVIRKHALAHQYKIIRDRAGKMLFLLGTFAYSSSLWAIGSSPIALSAMPLDQLLISSALSDDANDGDDKSEESHPEQDSRLHARETAMQWLSCCEKHGDGRDILAVIDQLLPVALLSQSHPKVEVVVQAKNVTDAVSLSLRLYFVPRDVIGERAVTRLLELLKRLSTSKTWKTRGAVLRFTMTFAFYHWIFFSIALKEQVHAFICSFLTDDQREVQAMATFALRGLLHNEQQSAVEAMSVRMTESAGQARVKFPKLTRRFVRLQDEGTSEEELKKIQQRLKALEAKMTESVLSLSAIVLAFPHEVPSFVPPIFEELGHFLYMKRTSNTISFLEKAVKETLLDFKRTHQDNWLETKALFSQSQLDVIEDVAIAPSYFS